MIVNIYYSKFNLSNLVLQLIGKSLNVSSPLIWLMPNTIVLVLVGLIYFLSSSSYFDQNFSDELQNIFPFEDKVDAKGKEGKNKKSEEDVLEDVIDKNDQIGNKTIFIDYFMLL